MMKFEQAQGQATSPSPEQTRAELREQIQGTILDAQEAAVRANADARLARLQALERRGGTETILVPPPTGRNSFDQMPSGVVDISIGFFIMCAVMVVGWPLARAIGRRIERRGEGAAVSPQMADQLQRIEQAVDAISIEIERISESQRFVAKLQSAERAALSREG